MIELTTAALFLLGTIYGGAPANVTETEIAPIVREAIRPITLEEYIRDYFKDIPMLAEIAKCESNFRHLDKDGKVLRGEQITEDVGVMQINEFYHERRADNLGFDLRTLEDNLAYAKWLYAKEGLIPWYSSEKCWQRFEQIAQKH